MSSNALVKSVVRAMERIAPLRLAEKWDNVGLLLESPIQNPSQHRVLLTIDLTPAVLAESVEKKAAVIVAYHPTLFRPVQSLTLSNPLQSSLLQCAAQGISVYSPHTAIDSVWGGNNDWLAAGVLGITFNGTRSNSVRVLAKEEKLGPDGQSEGGEARLVTLPNPIAIGELVNRIKGHLNLQQIQVAYSGKTDQAISTVAICAGSGGSVLLGKEADVYFTGEMAHHEVLAAVADGRHVVLCMLSAQSLSLFRRLI
ncbi:hypothetical protein HGRIS_008801 [Hohenbuehelia grisea]|uniref:Nif3-like dinuclear metal center hexameric protein n=1 Tax=Hohenbuehelia grisea TaxID=104357 RepID=A0ABR3J939_9AGAR